MSEEQTPNRFEEKAYQAISIAFPRQQIDVSITLKSKLLPAIATALEAAYQEGRNDENAIASSAVVAEAYWRHMCATPDGNTQTEEEIHAQNEDFERQCLFFMCQDYSEQKPLLTDVQIGEIRRRYQAIKGAHQCLNYPPR